MSIKKLTTPWPWQQYSRKLVRAILNPHSAGSFSKEEAEARNLFLAQGREGEVVEGNALIIYWLVDPEDGVIADAKFQLFGHSALIGAAEAACQLSLRKNYDQARRITPELLDRHFHDKSGVASFPDETRAHLELVVGALVDTARQCEGLPLPSAYVATPMPSELGEGNPDGYPGFKEMNQEQKINLIRAVLDEDVAPYIAMDGGGVDPIAISDDLELVVAYSGNCTSCFASTGSTLSYIQQVLRTKVHPEIVVAPDASTLPTWAG